MKYLLDTNVISEAHRPQCDPIVRATLDRIDATELAMSVITIGELAKGIALLPTGACRQGLQDWLADTERMFVNQILPIDSEIARLWGRLTADAKSAGRPLGTADGLIAATAIRHGLRLLTRNVDDFAETGVQLLNPWVAE